MRILFILSLMALPLSACRTTVQDRDTRVIVDDGDRYDYERGPRHCPPGHAKKGWC